MDWKIQKVRDGRREHLTDVVADEEPLQITVDGFPVAVVMRTPGHDLDLVAGFLRSERVLEQWGDVVRVDLEKLENHALVFLKGDLVLDKQRLQRNVYSASSCGICGKASIESITCDVEQRLTPIDVGDEVLLGAPDKLRDAQEMFAQSGGIHAAGLFTILGDLLVVREDVGRHNAIDKCIGWAWREGFDLSEVFLQVSGRVSFEVVQKAYVAGIPMVVAISAPTSLAVEFAQQAGMQLFGFVRGGGFNKY